MEILRNVLTDERIADAQRVHRSDTLERLGGEPPKLQIQP